MKNSNGLNTLGKQTKLFIFLPHIQSSGEISNFIFFRTNPSGEKLYFLDLHVVF